MPRHVHADLIKAWADGEVIQQYSGGGWFDCLEAPLWKGDRVYRIKPKPLTYKVKFFVYNAFFSAYNHVCSNVRTEEEAFQWEKDPRFIKWITDWVEYDV